MKTFNTFTEAYRPTNLNWNVQPAIKAAAGPPEGLVVYHKDIGLPTKFEKPRPGLRLTYGAHSHERMDEKGVPVPSVLPEKYQIIEVQMEKYKVVKWVLRFPIAGSEWDAVMVVQPDGFVRTTWPNERGDLHRTLDRSKYEAKPNF